MKYRAEIDGLRAIAVVPVIFFHAGFEMFSGGFVGVDVFFVISGYLITTIIINEMEKGNFNLLNFYERRARRILPALFFVVWCCIPVAWFVLLPIELKDFAQSIIAVATFSSNILFWHESGYFATAAELKPLLHTWSLAVEEQFYIFFPLFLMAAWRFGKKAIVWILGAAFLVSLGIAHWGAYNAPSFTFYMLITRGWELLIGSFAAFYLQKQSVNLPHQVFNFLSAFGLAGIICAVFVYNKITPFPSLYALLPTIGTVFIILFANKGTLVHRLLSLKAVVGVGLISYSLYLWHQPVFVFLRNQRMFQPTEELWVAAFLFVVVAAYLTWSLVEASFRNQKTIPAKTIFLSSSVSAIALIALGSSVYLKFDDVKQIWLKGQTPELQNLIILLEEKNTLLSNYGADKSGKQQLANCRFNINQLNFKLEEKLLECFEKHDSGILILGDSHAIDFFGVVASRFENQFLIGVTRGGCRPHTPLEDCHYEPVRKFIELHPNVFRHVIFEQAGFYLLKKEDGKKGNRNMFNLLGLNADVEGIIPDDEHIDGTFRYLEKISKYVPVTWFGPRIEPHITISQVLRQGCTFPFKFRNGVAEIFNNLDHQIEDITKQEDRIKFVSQIQAFKFSFPKDYMSCDAWFWSDGDHLSAVGEERFGRRLPDKFLEFE